MASIISRDKSFAVVYYASVNGEKKQIWESFPSKKEATQRKAEVENEINDGTFIPPSKQTIKEYLNDYVNLYGVEHWSLSTYSSNIAFIENYVYPLIGEEPIQSFTVKSADMYIKQLRKTKPVESQYHRARSEYAGASVIDNRYKLLRCAFGKAVNGRLSSETRLNLSINRNAIIRHATSGTLTLSDLRLTNAGTASCMLRLTSRLLVLCGWVKS